MMDRPRLSDANLREQVMDWMGEWVDDYDVDASAANMRAKIDAATDDIVWPKWDDDDARATYNDRVSACWQSDDWLVEKERA